MKPLVNVSENQAPCGVCDASDDERHYYHVTSPDGRMQAEWVVCEACLYEILLPWYPDVEEDAAP